MTYHEHHELAACEEQIFLVERELELLGWLPTSAVSSTLDRLWREHERRSWLARLRCFEQSDGSGTTRRA